MRPHPAGAGSRGASLRRSDSRTPLADEIRRHEPSFTGVEGERFRCPLPGHGGNPDGDAWYHAAGWRGREYESFRCGPCARSGGITAYVGRRTATRDDRPRRARRVIVDRQPDLAELLPARRDLIRRSVDLLSFRRRSDARETDEGIAELHARFGGGRPGDNGEADEAIAFLAAEGLVGLNQPDAPHSDCGFRLLFPIRGHVAAEDGGEPTEEITSYAIRRVVATRVPCGSCVRMLAAGRDLRFRFAAGPQGVAPVYGAGIRRAVRAAAGGDLLISEGAFDTMTALGAGLTLGVVGLVSNGSREQLRALAAAIREAQERGGAPARVVLLAQSDEAFQANVRHAAEHLGRVLPVLVTSREAPAALGQREKWDLSDLARVVGPAEAVRLLLETASIVEPPPPTPTQLPRGARPAQSGDVVLEFPREVIALDEYPAHVEDAARTVLGGRSVLLLGRPEAGKTSSAILSVASEIVRRERRVRPLDSAVYAAESFALAREKCEAFRGELEAMGFAVVLVTGRSPDEARPGYCSEHAQRAATAAMDSRDPCIGCPARATCAAEPETGSAGGFVRNFERVRRLLGHVRARRAEARRTFVFTTIDFAREHADLFAGVKAVIGDEDPLRRFLARATEIDARDVGDADLPRFLDPASVPRYASNEHRDRDLAIVEELVSERRRETMLGRRRRPRSRTAEPVSFPVGLAFEVFQAVASLLRAIEDGFDGVVTGRAGRRYARGEWARDRLSELPEVVREAIEHGLVVPPYEPIVSEADGGSRTRWVSPPRWDFEIVAGVGGPAIGRRLVSIARDVLRGRALVTFDRGDPRRGSSPPRYVVWAESRGGRRLFERGKVLGLSVTTPNVPELYAALNADRRQLWHDAPNLRTSMVLGRSWSQTNADARADVGAHVEAFLAKAKLEGRVSAAIISKATRTGPLGDVDCARPELGHFGLDEKATNRFQDAGATEIHVASWTQHVSEVETFAAWVALLAGRPLPDFETRREWVRVETTDDVAAFSVLVGAKNGAGGVPVAPLYRAVWLSEVVNTRGNALGRTRPGRDPDREHRAFLYGGPPIPGFPIAAVHDVATFADRHGVDLRRVRLQQDASVLERDRAATSESARRRGEALGALLRGEVDDASARELIRRFGLRSHADAVDVLRAYSGYVSTMKGVTSACPERVQVLLKEYYSYLFQPAFGAGTPREALARSFEVLDATLPRPDKDTTTGPLGVATVLRELRSFGFALPTLGPSLLGLTPEESRAVDVSTSGKMRAKLAALRAGTCVTYPDDPRSRASLHRLVRLVLLRAAAVEAGLAESVADWRPDRPVTVAEAIETVNASARRDRAPESGPAPVPDSARNGVSTADVFAMGARVFPSTSRPENVRSFAPQYLPPQLRQLASALAAIGFGVAIPEHLADVLFARPTHATGETAA